jgi:hypothetical protein
MHSSLKFIFLKGLLPHDTYWVMAEKEHTVLLCHIVMNIALLPFDYKDLIYFFSV